MALKGSAVRVRYAPGFVKQRIRVPDTLFFYAQAGQNGLPPGVGLWSYRPNGKKPGQAQLLWDGDFSLKCEHATNTLNL